MAFTIQSGSGGMMSEINVTPFVDVMLVLLVIFMVTAPLIQQSVDVDLPETRSRKAIAVQENDVVLTINERKQIFVAQAQVKAGELTAKLEQIYKFRPKKEIFLKADKRVPYGFVVQVMAHVKNAGIDRMGMITDPET